MAIKIFKFTYGLDDAEAVFKVDTDVFTPDLANATLEFFTWDYDEDNDPVEEVMKKYAIQAIKIVTFSHFSTHGVISEFQELEGFAPIDGSLGILLTSIEGFDFNEDELSVSIS